MADTKYLTQNTHMVQGTHKRKMVYGILSHSGRQMLKHAHMWRISESAHKSNDPDKCSGYPEDKMNKAIRRIQPGVLDTNEKLIIESRYNLGLVNDPIPGSLPE